VTPTDPARPRLLCVPGLGLDEAAWTPTLASLPGRGGVVVRLPGYGARPSRSDDLRPAALAASLVAEHLPAGSAPTVLLGHSASCQVVVRAAALAPDRVAALVLVGPTTDPRACSWPGLVQRWLRTAVWERPGQVPVLARAYTRTGLLWMGRAMEAARRDDVRDGLAAVRCPVLVVRGRHDRICPKDWAEELAALSPAASRAVTLDRGAHMVPLTQGVRLAATIDGFAARAPVS
jgi:pimeloyl-ACP methyl ester carboxylesterase